MTKAIERNNLSFTKQYVSCAIASFGCVCAGSVLAWTSPALPQLQDATLHHPPITESEGGFIGSIVAIGAAISSLPAGYAAEKFGSKTTLKCLAFPFVGAWIALGFSQGLVAILASRFLGGFASGAICVCVPMYISEVASVEIRGILGSFFQISFCLGILLVNVMGACMHWRELTFSLSIFPIIYLIALNFIPDMKRVDAKAEFAILQEENKPETVLDQLRKPNNYKALRVALGLVSFQQLSGVNAVIFYTSTIFAAAGSSFSPAISTIIVAAAQLLFSFASAALIERFNRRFYLLTSGVGMSLTLLLLAAYFHCKHSSITFPGMNLVPIISLVLFILAYCAGYGPIPWLMMGELFAADFKGVGCGCATMFNWGLVFCVTSVFPIISSELGQHNTFYIFSLLNLGAAVFAVYVVPETRGKTSKEIQEGY